VHSQDLKQIEKQLKSANKGKLLTIRGFYGGDQLRFDSEGNLLKGGEPGPWTVSGKIEVVRLEVSENELRILGNRLYLHYDRGKKRFQHLRSNEKVWVEIATGQSKPTLSAFVQAIGNVFLSGDEQLAQHAPAYWREFLRGNETEDCPAANSVARASQTVPEPRRLSYVNPRYTKAALWGRINAKIKLAAVINEQGGVESVRILEPAGMGLDDAAADAVGQWVYEPTSVNGRTVPVCTVVTLEFRVY